MLLLSARSTETAAPTFFLCTSQSGGTVAQGQEKLAQSEGFFLLSRPANLAPFKDAIFFSPLKKIP